MRWCVTLIVLAGCAGRARSEAQAEDAATVTAVDDAAAPADPRRWIAGDLHQHVSPLDDVEGQTLDAAALAARAHDVGAEFLILTPHLRPSTWRTPAKRKAWLAKWKAMRAVDAPITVIAGAEYTVYGYGHFGVSGVDLAALDGGDVLSADGAVVVVNHPYAVPTHVGVRVSDMDLSFRPWTTGKGEVPRLDGVEVWNMPLDLANTISTPGGATGEERAFAAADALARASRRHVAVVGGNDNHRAFVRPSTWVLAADAGEASILTALRAGATCVGGADAGSLEARGDGAWARIGEAVRGDRVELRWTGVAQLFVDGQDRGEHDGGWIHADAAGPHTYRIVVGDSRCGFVYANL